jgi:uncharacterized SAM-binding protein YcdF (DUF218 family)
MKNLVQNILSIILAIPVIWMAGFAAFAFISLNISPDSTDKKNDSIVVLTGAEGRIEEGLSLLTKGVSGNLFISGTNPDVTPSEIKSMWKGSPPLPDCCVTLGCAARTTFDNAREIDAWLAQNPNIKSIRLLTSNYHLIRAYLDLKLVLPHDIEITLHPVRQKNLPIAKAELWILLFGEYHKTLFRLLNAYKNNASSRPLKICIKK